MSSQEHRQKATSQGSIAIAIVTVSDTRTPETDRVGRSSAHLPRAPGIASLVIGLSRMNPIKWRMRWSSLSTARRV